MNVINKSNDIEYVIYINSDLIKFKFRTVSSLAKIDWDKTEQHMIRLQGSILSKVAYQNQFWIIHHSTEGTFFFKCELFYFYLGLLKEQAMLYVLLDIENDHYLTDPLGTISKSKFIWMKFI